MCKRGTGPDRAWYRYFLQESCAIKLYHDRIKIDADKH